MMARIDTWNRMLRTLTNVRKTSGRMAKKKMIRTIRAMTVPPCSMVDPSRRAPSDRFVLVFVFVVMSL
jgi:hypothetical protein